MAEFGGDRPTQIMITSGFEMMLGLPCDGTNRTIAGHRIIAAILKDAAEELV